MFEPQKLVTSWVRVAATVAGAVILLPFCAFADLAPAIPDQISLPPLRNHSSLLREGKLASSSSRLKISANLRI